MPDLPTYTVDVIAGDGIGPEVMPPATACVDALAPAFDFRIQWRDRDRGSDHYRRHGRMMPVDGIDQVATGQLWAAAMMLDHLGQPAAAAALVNGFESALAAGVRTRDLGGSASTTDFRDAVLDTCRRAVGCSDG